MKKTTSFTDGKLTVTLTGTKAAYTRLGAASRDLTELIALSSDEAERRYIDDTMQRLNAIGWMLRDGTPLPKHDDQEPPKD